MFNPFAWLKPVGRFLKKALGFVEKVLSDENIERAVFFVKMARDMFDTAEERRDFVVKQLMGLGLPENVARLALEIAVGLVKAEEA